MSHEDTQRTPLVYCRRIDRLGARLRNLLCAFCFAETINGRLMLFWPIRGDMIGENSSVPDGMSHSFYELFDRDLIATTIPWLEIVDQDPTPRGQRPFAAETNVSSLPSCSLASLRERGDSTFFYDMTSPFRFSDITHNRSNLAKAFERLPLHPAVDEALRAVTTETRINDGIAVHVRRGDIMAITLLSTDKLGAFNNTRRAQIFAFATKYAPYESYIRAINSLPGAERSVAVFSDDPEMKAVFQSDLPHRYVDYDSILDRMSLTPCQRDFVELLLISKAADSIGTRSAFVELAALIGNTKHQRLTKYITTDAIVRSLNQHITEQGDEAKALRVLILEEYLKIFSHGKMVEEAEKVRSALLSMG